MAGWTIPVVDDEPCIRSLAKSVLERHGHRIFEAADGVEAITIWERSPVAIDLLLTDIVMPGMDGLELAHQLFSRSPRVRILYMSGKCERGVCARLRQPQRLGVATAGCPHPECALTACIGPWGAARGFGARKAVATGLIARRTPPAHATGAVSGHGCEARSAGDHRILGLPESSTYPACEIDVVQEQIGRRGFGFIRKPFNIEDLRLAVTRMLDQPRKKAPASEGAPRPGVRRRVLPAK
jgi:CheY-like chemotaxis protein